MYNLWNIVGMVVYDALRDVAWRFMHPAMFPDPDFSDYTVAGERFTLMDGIVGLAHSAKLATVFFQPLATDRYQNFGIKNF